MKRELKSMVDYDLSEIAEIINRGFSDYFVKIEVNVTGLLHMVAQDSLSMDDSRVVVRDGEKVAVALIARRGWSSRLAAMAVVPEARGERVGTWLTERLLAESEERGERRMELEVIEENAPGVRLYKKSGFRVLRRLVSFELSGSPEETEEELEDADIREVARMVTAHGLGNLPWQVSGESLACMGPPDRAFKLGGAYAAISKIDMPALVIRSIVVEPRMRGKGQGRRLLKALRAKYRGKAWSVPALCPEEMGGLFERAGFKRGELSQFHMVNEWT